MENRERALPAVDPLWSLVAVGVLLVVFGAAQAGFLLTSSASLTEAVIDFTLIGGPGLALLYGGYHLSRTSIDPAVYPRILLWSFGGMAVMVLVVGLLTLNPGGSVNRPVRAVAIAGGLGAVGGFLVGTNEARAISRAREAERVQAELRDTVARLERSNDRLEQFAYAASHDLQEPLRMVSSYLQLIERRYGDVFDEEGEEYLEFAVDGADRMREMIEGVLEYSRVESQGDPFESVDLETVVEDVRSDLRVRIEETDAGITVDPLPRVEGDRSQLHQVFQNLLDNAIEYSGDEPPRVHVSAERATAGDRWVISVSDEGIGIDPDYHEQIFEAFQRLHSPGDASGTGIGLAVCERIVERHDGEMWVESDPGEGSTFYFTLRSADEERQHPVTESESVA